MIDATEKQLLQRFCKGLITRLTDNREKQKTLLENEKELQAELEAYQAKLQD